MAVFPRLTFLVFALRLAAAEARDAGMVQADLLPLAMQPRTGAPALFDLRLTHRGAGLLEGRVEITLHEYGQPLLRWTTQELALAGGSTQTLRLLTPPLPPRHVGATLDATLLFLTARGPIALGTGPFAPEARLEERRAVIAICGAREGQSAAPDAVPAWHRFRPTGLRTGSARQAPETVATAPIFFEPEEFPVDPLVLCAFDLMLLRESALEKLRPRTAEALVRWLEGGGCLAILGATVQPAGQRAALDRLLAAGRGGAALEAGEPALPGVLRAYAGLGRCAVLGPPSGEADDEPWKRAADFLWSRKSEDAEAAKTARWLQTRQQRLRPPEDPAATFQVLMPANVKLLPAWQVFGILAVLVALVGPIDWLVLGRLRARRWTWALFPIAVAAATAATILLADRSLGQTAHRGAVTIKDLGPDGRVLRQHRFELTLAPRTRAITDSFAAALVAPLPAMRSDGQRFAEGENARAVSYRGQFPARYEMQRAVQQWSPSIVRTLAFGGEDDSGLPWELFTRTGTKFREAAGGWQMLAISRGVDARSGPWGIFTAAFLKQTVGTNADGTARETVAPNGNALCEDLGMSDRADPRQWLVIAVRRAGPDVQVYRRLFFQ